VVLFKEPNNASNTSYRGIIYVCRKNGVRSYMMPRPREGMRAVDAAILPMLDLDVSE
jgi:hypothetical protein